MSEKNDSNPNEPKKAGQPVSRRDFVGAVAKLMALGALSHFALLAGKSLAGVNDDWCPYGKPPPDGGDECNPGAGNEDVCLDGSNTNDACPDGNKSEDKCTSGKSSEDVCTGDGSLENGGDYCYGGGGTTGGQEQDKCEDGSGDECHPPGIPGGFGHDNCKEAPEKPEDLCGGIPWSDDTCYDGDNRGGIWNPGKGGADFCWGDMWAMDKCFDGTDKQDICIGPGADPHWGREDVCFGAQTDHCGGKGRPNDPDECLGGLPVEDSDECRPGRESGDQQPPGGSR